MFRVTLLAALAAAVAARSLPIGNSLATRSALPTSFKWTSTQVLVGPKNDGRRIDGVKDPSIIQIDDTYHVFASTASDAQGYNLLYFNFTDFAKAGEAPFFYLDQAPLGTGYRAAPEVFYFEPQKLWYLVYQDGNAAYSTNADISNPAGWTAPQHFYSGTPALIQEGLEGGYWVDMWVVCDAKNCHLFSSDDNGRLYRSQTPIENFPKGMSEPVIALKEASKYDLFEASTIYSIGNGTYLTLVECIGANGRYFRSWTSPDIAGPYTPLAATEANPFLGLNNVDFPSGPRWSKSISHGELIRTNVDQNLYVEPCNFRFLYQGVDPTVESSGGSYNALPWKLALVTQTNSQCSNGTLR
ncbi:glycoside hydrolase family 62 protein [Periconia macrospinosa]|uniref:Alpha-L-arabinofuranosidase n=1 Tax=Periconia macrospinosa TaxID=97972 RepID=A0A2V1DXH6_9PLEO|nr:glycoside hydrolase family 62 protein [Periconia macrospinosa]